MTTSNPDNNETEDHSWDQLCKVTPVLEHIRKKCLRDGNLLINDLWNDEENTRDLDVLVA